MDDRRSDEQLGHDEARLPDADAPSALSPAVRRSFMVPAGLAAAVIALAVLLSLTRGTGVPGADPSGGPSTTPSPGVSPTGEPASPAAASSTPGEQSLDPSASAPSALQEIAWQQTGDFGVHGGPAWVHDVAIAEFGLVAVGVQYASDLPSVGPTPAHDGRVWHSPDGGLTWVDTTPVGAFANVELIAVAAEAGSVLAFGAVSGEGVDTEYDFLDRVGTAVYESTDGVTWTEIEGAFPADVLIIDVASGERGHVATARADADSAVTSLWYSADGRVWEEVHALPPSDGYPDVAAGEEGFVAAGATDDYLPFAAASSDGRTWTEAEAAPESATYRVQVVAVGPDWILMSEFPADPDADPHSDVWRSENGLDWLRVARLPLQVHPSSEGCREWLTDLSSSGSLLVATTVFSYPCSEGGFARYGPVRLSLDGRSWGAGPSSLAPENDAIRSGTGVTAALSLDGRLVLVGESNGRAAMWIGDAP